MHDNAYKAFVSSTYLDLKDHRARVIGALRGMGMFVDPMEDWKADSDEPKKISQERMEGCDLCVLLVAFRRGYIPDGETKSITQLEYEAAVKQGVEIRVYLLNEEAAWPRKFDELDKDPNLRVWRTQLGKKHGVEFFSTDASTLDVSGAIGRWLTKKNKGQPPAVQRIDWPEGQSPYPGLEWFDEEYAPLFFGREREVADILAKMREPKGRLLIISGASGSGKSSLVGAGLWKALIKEGRLAGSTGWKWMRMQPSDGETPWQALTAGLKSTFPKIKKRPVDLAREFSGGETSLSDVLQDYLTTGQELVLFIDQLEEVFTQGFAQEDVRPFINGLVEMAHASGSRIRVLATIRSEFIETLSECETVRTHLNQGYQYLVGSVSPRMLQDMIERPAQATGYQFQDNLVGAILDEAGKEPGSLPLVAYTLKQLFDQRKRRTLTQAAYKKMKGVVGAIGTKAEQVLRGLDEGVLAAWDGLFAELVHVERERPPTRMRVPLSSFQNDGEALKLIQALSGQDCRVLVTSGEEAGRLVEVAHERLFTGWDRLKNWIEKSGEALRLIDHAEEAAQRWKGGRCQSQEVWPIHRVQEVQTALQQCHKQPSRILDDFLKPQWMLIEQLKNPRLSHKDRMDIGMKLAEFGDPRPGVGVKDGIPDIKWIDIPGGKIRLEGVKKVFTVKPFLIAKYPVTNAQFQAFIDDGGYDPDQEWWKGILHQEVVAGLWEELNAPRENVSWFEAVAFCRWLSARTGKSIRLPTEWEWQQAATGGNPANDYPWRTEWDPARCNSGESRLNRTTPVGLYPQGATMQGVQGAQGVMDMAGNVWEWCLNEYDHSESSESVCLDDSESDHVLRGGSWDYYNPESLRSSYRDRTTSVLRYHFIGFRLAQDIR